MSRDRTAILIACVAGTVCLFGLLTYLSLREQSTARIPAAASTPFKESKAAVQKSASTGASASRRQLVDQGNKYGNDGDWQKAYECFRQVVASGTSAEWEFCWAAASALAVGDTNACEQYCIQFMKMFGKTKNADVAQRLAKECFGLPHASEELVNQAMERADWALSKDRNNYWQQLAKGMGEHRRGNWSSALEWLRQVEASGRLSASIQAWCFGAMARYQLGDTAGARSALDQMDLRVNAMVRTGELDGWKDLARAIGVRTEAEQLVFGKVVSPPVNPSELVANREKWKAVTYELNAADQMGKQSQWVPAAEYYSKALQDPAFDWTVFEVRQDLLAQRMAAVFLLAGDQTRYCDLVRALLERKVDMLSTRMQERYAQIFVLSAELPPELKTRALAYARRVYELPDAATNPWLRLLQGATEYREGHFDTALETLGQVFFPPADSVGAARAMAFKAMACKRLGRTKEAVEATQEANALFAKTRGGDWTNPAFYQIAMKELLAMLAETTKAQ